MPSTAVIQTNATTTIVAARPGYAIRVLAWCLSFSAAANAKFQSHALPTDLTGWFYGGVNVQAVSPSLGSDVNRGHFQTLPGEALDINLSAAGSVGGYVVYEYVGT
jgi:hypothetical protein